MANEKLRKNPTQKQQSVNECWYILWYWPYVLIICAVACVYFPSLAFSFSPMDDRLLIEQRQELLSEFGNITQLFSQNTLLLYYRPMLNVSFMIDMLVGGSDPSIFHFSNILLHGICCLTLFRFCPMIGTNRASAFFIAIIYAVHPIHTQAVSWVPGRNDTLLMMFTLFSCVFLIRTLRENDARWLALFILFFGCALLTKENAMGLPVIFGAIAWLYARQNNRRTAIKYTLGTLLLSAAFLFLRNSFVQSSLTDKPINFVGLMQGFFMQTGKILLPIQQAIVPLTENTSTIPYVAVLSLLCFAIWKFGVRNKTIAVFAALWFGTLILLPVYAGAVSEIGEHYEHRMYAPALGIIILVSQINLPLSGRQARITVTVLVLLFAIKTFQREAVYSSKLSYVLACTKESPQISWFHDIAGIMMNEQGDYLSALQYYSKAIEVDSSEPQYFNHRGNTYSVLHRYRDAWHDYNKVLSLDSLQKETYISRSIANYSLKDYSGARRDLEKGETLGAQADPAFVKALNTALGRIKN